MKKLMLIFFSLFLLVNTASALPVLWVDNGHYYDFVPFTTGSSTWQQALAIADGASYLGLPGHLTTITSSDENTFINSLFSNGETSRFAWIGGYEPNDDGGWRWATGPELGIQFSQGVNPTAPFNYANWGGIEPNDNGPSEDYAMFNLGSLFAGGIATGQWADAEPFSSSLDPVVGYLVEFEQFEPSNAIPEPATFFLFSAGLLGSFKLKTKKRS